MANVIVEVLWDDAAFYDKSYSRTKAARVVDVVRVRSVGYFIAATDAGVIISQSTDDNKNNDGDVSESLMIPWGMLVEWRDICGHQ